MPRWVGVFTGLEISVEVRGYPRDGSCQVDQVVWMRVDQVLRFINLLP